MWKSVMTVGAETLLGASVVDAKDCVGERHAERLDASCRSRVGPGD